ncbi:helix-turn-helix domain-containing protein [Altererythrobacter lutimaris]|uniref:Helix-turn-helix domain-containing protein n=1 Tax=Altererythrobacter lutimaris TaxID=2743979 RepID=A0A850HDM5_9SPHN|nr:helix-turn-helix domain-containing protein [Altererythrobacter lutimaris]NVE94848.1 helix-turn-helix domain-containing protein [Altererythrobacter lutimaris]
MSDTEEALAEELALESVGQKLRRKREEMGLSVAQVASETRIPEHHLQTIESGDFSALPAKTYAVGFTRTYARLLGMDELTTADEVRAELAAAEDARQARQNAFEPGDPGKLPSAGLAWAGGAAALILAIGAFSFYSTFYGAGTGPAPLQPDTETQVLVAANDTSGSPSDSAAGIDAAPVEQAALTDDGQVIFTALEDGMWVRFYDDTFAAGGDPLFEGQMANGDTFSIPSTAVEPRINTGRPDAFAITINGREVPKLADEPVTMGDTPVSAEALLARVETAALDVAGPVPTPEPQTN